MLRFREQKVYICSYLWVTSRPSWNRRGGQRLRRSHEPFSSPATISSTLARFPAAVTKPANGPPSNQSPSRTIDSFDSPLT